jgi:hypothetical protein
MMAASWTMGTELTKRHMNGNQPALPEEDQVKIHNFVIEHDEADLEETDTARTATVTSEDVDGQRMEASTSTTTISTTTTSTMHALELPLIHRCRDRTILQTPAAKGKTQILTPSFWAISEALHHHTVGGGSNGPHLARAREQQARVRAHDQHIG